MKTAWALSFSHGPKMHSTSLPAATFIISHASPDHTRSASISTVCMPSQRTGYSGLLMGVNHCCHVGEGVVSEMLSSCLDVVAHRGGTKAWPAFLERNIAPGDEVDA